MTEETAAAQRRADLAMAAARGMAEGDLVLRSDAEGLALLGVDEDSPVLADVLRWQGTILRDRGRTDEAEALYQRSLRVAQHNDYLAGQSHAVNCLGVLAQRRGELTRASQLFLAAQRMAEGCRDSKLAGMIQQNRGVIADITGDCAGALRHYSESLQSFQEMNDLRAMTLVLNNLGLLHFRMREFDAGRGCYDWALSLAREREDLLSEGVIEENIADLEMRRGNLSAASEAIARALEIATLRQDPIRRASGLRLLCLSLRLGNRPNEALDPIRGALAICANADDALLEAELLQELALTLADTGDVAGARDSCRDALERFERIGAAAGAEQAREVLSTLGAAENMGDPRRDQRGPGAEGHATHG